jgi:hypothetical protein
LSKHTVPVPDKKTEIVDVVIVIWHGPEVWEEVRGGDWKVREGLLIPDKGPGWMGIRYHDQDVDLPSKWGVFFYLLNQVLCPNN